MQTSDNNTPDAASRPSGGSSRRRRVALAPHEGKIRDWVGEGRSDEWIASALGTSPASIQSFRSRRRISRTAKGEPPEKPAEGHRSSPVSLYEGTLEQGEEGYGLWLDPAVADDPLFEKGFGGVADVEVTVEKYRIVLAPAPGSRPQAPEESMGAGDSVSQLERIFGEKASRIAASSANTEEGKVRWFDPDKGYGFIYRPDAREIFFHHSEIKTGGTLPEGARVEYLVGENDRGPVATEVRLLR